MRYVGLKKYLYFLILIFIMFLLTAFLYIKFDQVLQTTSDEFQNLKVHEIEHNALSISRILRFLVGDLSSSSGDILKILRKNDLLRHTIDTLLSAFINDENRYVYIVYEDKGHNFRYLADGSMDKKERGFFGQKFFPLQEKKWQKAFNLDRTTIFMQESIDNLWITMLAPLHIFKNIKSFLVIDLSTMAYKNVKSIFLKLKHFLKYLIIFFIAIFLLIATLYFFLYREYRRTFLDPLTGAYNREFLTQLEKNIDLQKYIVAMIDLDYFKLINDLYGHDVGDEMLKKIAKTIINTISYKDILIRYGGDEFLLLLQKDKKEDFKSFFDRLHRNINETALSLRDSSTLKTTSSIGINLMPNLEESLSDAIKKADMELYRAKNSGRNRFKFYETQDRKVGGYISFNKISQLVKEGNIELHFQPIYNFRTKQIDRYEALARLRDGDTLYLPHQFLIAIFQTNVYREFAKQVVRQAFEVIKKERVVISINFNKSDFLDEEYFKTIKELIERNKSYRQFLILELLENEELKIDDEKILDKIKYFQRIGCKIALDDFGSGYSNFNYFLTLEPDIIKLDGSLIRQLDTNPNAKKLIQSIVLFAKHIGIETIGECVEDEKTLQIMERLNIDGAQGYFIGKPMPYLQREPFEVFGRIDTDAA